MTQFINYKDNAQGEHTVMFYHTVPSKEGTPDFEHKGFVKVKDVRNAKRPHDGAEDPDILEIACPIPGCGSVAYVPVLGDEEAQRLHAKVRHARGEAASFDAAVDSVIDDVKARGGIPRLERGRG